MAPPLAARDLHQLGHDLSAQRAGRTPGAQRHRPVDPIDDGLRVTRAPGATALDRRRARRRSLLLAACGSTEQAPAESSTGAGVPPPAAPTSRRQQPSQRPRRPRRRPRFRRSPRCTAAPTSAAAPAGTRCRRRRPPPCHPVGWSPSADMAQAAAAVAAMSLPDQAGSVIMASSADAVGTDVVSRLHLGGVILMGSKGAIDGTEGGTPAEVAAVTAALQSQVPASQAGAPLLIATRPGIRPGDPAGQRVHRLPRCRRTVRHLRHRRRSRRRPKSVTAASRRRDAGGRRSTSTLRRTPMCCPESGPSGVDDRSFGSDPERAGTLVAAAVRGYQSAGLAATIKHFPGIGRLATDTHKALPSLDVGCDEWNAVESVPMRAGVDAGSRAGDDRACRAAGGRCDRAVVRAEQRGGHRSAARTGPRWLQRPELPRRDGLRLVRDGAGPEQLRAGRGGLARDWPPVWTSC